MTVPELLVTIAVMLTISLAVASMYVGSMETWEISGASLALQRDADIALERMAEDVRHSSKIVVTDEGTTLEVIRIATSIGDSTVATYTLVDSTIVNGLGDVVLENVEEVVFDSPDGWRVHMNVRLRNNRGRRDSEYDDATSFVSTSATVRNLPASH